METIYLDHNATTPTRSEVIDVMTRCYREGLANPASQHRPGQLAHQLLEDAREGIADILGADLTAPVRDRLILTSSGTEANCLAILGITQAKTHGCSGHLVISTTEHSSVAAPAERLAQQGWKVDKLAVASNGVVHHEALPGILTPQTGLVSIAYGNHETGVLQPIADIARACRDRGVPCHTDAVQVAGKLDLNFHDLGVDAMSIAAHKFGGPVGIGALVVRSDVQIEPLMFGGHQQWKLRPGTESVPLAVGMLTALRLWRQEQTAHRERLLQRRTRFELGLKQGIPDVVIHGVTAERLPQTSNVAFPGLDGQMLLVALDVAGVACSMGAACASGARELSPTLQAMGIPHEQVVASLRFSLGVSTSDQEIDIAVARIRRVVESLRDTT